MPKYRIHFADGKTVDKTAATGTEAKQAAKRERQRELPANYEHADPSIRVERVEDLGAGSESV